MAQMRLIIIVANLVLVRLALAATNGADQKIVQQQQQQQQESTNRPNIDPQQVAALSNAALEQVNSLDFASNSFVEQGTSESQAAATMPGSQIEENQQQTRRATPELSHQSNHNKSHRDARKLDNSGQVKRKRHQNLANFSSMLLNLLAQLEKVDVKKMISDSFSSQQQQPKSSTREESSKLSQIYVDDSIKQANSTKKISNKSKLNNTILDHQQLNGEGGGKAREGVNVSALGGDTGNLLSITKQLVKLARSQMVGSEYGSTYPGSSSWFSSPLVMPSMLSAASHMFHDSTNDFTAASLKSDWFWVVVPAVIVIGAGVIVVPLIAAWLVSHFMNQNTFTVSAGRRRRRRKRGAVDQFEAFPNQSYPDIHEDLFKMLNLHRLLDDAPQLLVDKLSRFYKALDSVGSTLTNSTINKTKELDNALDSKLINFKKTLGD